MTIKYEDLCFEILNKTHIINTFCCGDIDLNRFLKTKALLDQNASASVTYIVSIKFTDKIIGYFTIINDSIKIIKKDLLSKKEEKYYRFKGKLYPSMPAVKIARNAVCNDFREKGIGTNMLRYICHLYQPPVLTGGASFVTADVYPSAKTFYLKNGFKEFEDYDNTFSDNIQMYVPLYILVTNLYSTNIL